MKKLLLIVGGAFLLFNGLADAVDPTPNEQAPADAVMSDGRPVNIGTICTPDAAEGVTGKQCSHMRRDTYNYQAGYLVGDTLDELWLTLDGWNIPRRVDQLGEQIQQEDPATAPQEVAK